MHFLSADVVIVGVGPVWMALEGWTRCDADDLV